MHYDLPQNHIAVRLARINSNHERLRTDTVIGFCRALPHLGTQFTLFARGLTHKDTLRLVETTIVQSIEVTENTIEFDTTNTHYKLSILTAGELVMPAVKEELTAVGMLLSACDAL